MSLIPSGPGARPNKSVWARHESEGHVSATPVFTDAPRLTGVDQGSSTLPRVATQMSWPTYATWWIRQAVQRAVANQGQTIRIPVHVVERRQLLARAAKKLEVLLGRPTTADELAEETGLSIHHVEEALGAAQVSASLNQTVGSEDDAELGAMLADVDGDDPFEQADEALRNRRVHQALEGLPLRERRIVELRFGFQGEPQTLEAIGVELGLTRERVRQLGGQALRRIEPDLAA